MPITQTRMKAMIAANRDWQQAAQMLHLQLELVAKRHPEVLSEVKPLITYLTDPINTLEIVVREEEAYKRTVRQNDYRRRLRGGGPPNAPQHSLIGDESDIQFTTAEEWKKSL